MFEIKLTTIEHQNLIGFFEFTSAICLTMSSTETISTDFAMLSMIDTAAVRYSTSLLSQSIRTSPIRRAHSGIPDVFRLI